jgi:regulator of sigma E protease
MAGRALGFGIVEFAVGMGPVLFKRTKNGIQYSIRALPIGGMCRFLGEDQDIQDSRAFNLQKVWKRIVVVVSGPVMNLLFALIAAIVTLSIFGDLMPSVYEVTADSPAAVAGMQAGDIVIAVDGKELLYYNQISELIQEADSQSMQLTVLRNGEPVVLSFSDIYNEEAGKNLIGISMSGEHVKFGFGETIARSASYIVTTFTETLGFIGKAAQGQVTADDAGGPVKIVEYLIEALRSGGESVMRMMILISASLGIMNLLPIPALDGGRLVFMIIEAIRGKAIAPEKEGMVHFVGLILLFGLMILLTFSDIQSIIRGGA